MKFFPSDYRLLRFRSDEIAEGERLAAWREVLSQMLLNVSIEPLSKQAFQVDASLRAVPGIRFGMAVFGPCVSHRTPEMTIADNEDFYLLINTEGPFSVLQANTSTTLSEGDACFLSCSQPVDLLRPASGRLIFARFEYEALAALMPDIDGYSGHFIRSGNDALLLLTAYLRDLGDKQSLASHGLRTLVIAHIYGLLELALRSSKKGTEARTGDRSGTIQLRSLKKYILSNLASPGLSITAVSDATGLSARHIQRLFVAEMTTFSKFVLLSRLQNVHAALEDPKQRQRGVADIALAQGFGDVSAFNRAFRRHYGASPSAIRQSLSPAMP
jgi:AraC-like DNA-binding protein